MTASSHTPLPATDTAAVAAYWDRCRAELGLPDDLAVPPAEYFGDHVEMADELADLVIHGPKRATAGAIVQYEAEQEALPRVGDHLVILGGQGRPVAVTRTTWVRVGPLTSVDDAFARDEGEGDRTRAWWVEAHRGFFSRHLPTEGLPYHDDLDLLFERFSLVHVAAEGVVAEPRASRGSDATSAGTP